MSDPHARSVLHSAATNMGWALRQAREDADDIAAEEIALDDFWANGGMTMEETKRALKEKQDEPHT